MEEKGDKHLTVRIGPVLHKKLYFICGYEGRSGNGQILHLIRKRIEEFEKEHGKIELPKEEE